MVGPVSLSEGPTIRPERVGCFPQGRFGPVYELSTMRTERVGDSPQQFPAKCRIAGDAPRNGSILERYWLLPGATWYSPSLNGGPGLDEAVLAGALLRFSVIQQQ